MVFAAWPVICLRYAGAIGVDTQNGNGMYHVGGHRRRCCYLCCAVGLWFAFSWRPIATGSNIFRRRLIERDVAGTHSAIG